MATSRFKDRYRDFRKVFKENWALFGQSKLGKIGLYIIIFFVIMAVFAPVIPYANERDPVLWMAPDNDLIEVQYTWYNLEGGNVLVIHYNESTDYPVLARPAGMLADGSSLSDVSDKGAETDIPLESIYISTGNIGKGVIDINPQDATKLPPQITEPLPEGHYHRISSAIPSDMGAVNSSVVIYKLTQGNNGPNGRNSNIYITTNAGNLMAIRADQHRYGLSGSSDSLSPIEYNLQWRYHVNDSISESVGIFYGNQFTTSDDRVVMASDNGHVACFNPNNETPIWNVTLNGTGFFTPVSIGASNMTLLASRDGNIYALDIHNGTILWDNNNWTDKPDLTSIAVGDTFVNTYHNNALLFAGTTEGTIYGVRIYDEVSNSSQNTSSKNAGDVEQIIDLPSAQGCPVGGLYISASDNPRIYVGTTTYVNGRPTGTGAIYCIDVNKVGTDMNPLVWAYLNTIGGISSKPAYFSNLYVYFPLDSGNLYAVNIKDGNITWKTKIAEDSRVLTPLIAPKIPGGSAQAKYVTVAAETGEMTQLNTGGKYLAPLAPTWVKPSVSGNSYIMGTDSFGRDIFSQLVWGSRIALLVGFAASFFSVLIGIIVGVVAGYFGGWMDVVLMRFTDVILVMPFLPLIIVFAAVMGPSIWNIIIAITLVGWPGTARIIRSQVLSLKERPFIDAARVTGASNVRIMFRHIIPNVLPLAFLYMTFAVTGAILGEASLSFIGLGDPTTMSWGMMLYGISHGSGYTLTAWWWLLPPGLAITFLVLGFFLVGRAFEEIINPRLRRRR